MAVTYDKNASTDALSLSLPPCIPILVSFPQLLIPSSSCFSLLQVLVAVNQSMPDDVPISPRAAIRSWLQDVATKPSLTVSTERSGHAENHDPSKDHNRHSITSGPRVLTGPRHVQRSPHPSKSKHDKPKSRGDIIKENPLPEHRDPSGAQSPNLAERLGLYSPFRKFKEPHGDEEVDTGALSRPRKRRRRNSSADSYLETLKVETNTKHSHRKTNPVDKSWSIIEDRKDAKRHARHSTSISEKSEMKVPSPDRATKSYERRARHKTREDRYDLKETKKTQRKRDTDKENTKEKRVQPRKRKEKSGAALMHGFTAQNVSHDRLTVSCCLNGF